MRNPYIKTIDLDETAVPLSESSVNLDVTITTFPENADPMVVAVDGSGDAEWPAGVGVAFTDIDISRISVSGSSGDKVLIAGNSPA